MFNHCSSLIRLSICGLLLTAASLSLSCAKGESGPRSSYRPPTPAPTPVDSKVDQYPVQLLNGGSVKMTDLVGKNKVVLVNFWATWCGPCRLEIPDLIELQNDLKDQGFEVVGLSVEDPVRDREDVQGFVKEMEMNYKIGFTPSEMFMLFNGSDPRGVIPQTFIFDRNGRLIDSMKGRRPNFRAWAEGAIRHALNNS